MSQNLLTQGLSTEFQTYSTTCTSHLEKVLHQQESEYQNSLASQKSHLFSILSSHSSTIQDLNSILSHYTTLKNTRSTRLFTFLQKKQDTRKLKEIFSLWSKEFTQKKRKIRKMNTYVINFYKRGELRREFKFWKNEVQGIKREKYAKRSEEKTKEEIFKSIGGISEESERLRRMIGELTEDLRNETLAKNMLKSKFEAALCRGISALNSETAIVQGESYPAFASSSVFRRTT